MILGVFARLGDLFGELAHSRGLDIHDIDKNYTREFKLWCKKLDHLGADDIAVGIFTLESRIAEASSEGEKSYPPSYAEFIGLCTQEKSWVRSTFKRLPPSILTSKEKKERMKLLRRGFGL